LLHSFPNNIEHCLQWAREDAFEGHFVKDADIVNNYLTKAAYIDVRLIFKTFRNGFF